MIKTAYSLIFLLPTLISISAMVELNNPTAVEDVLQEADASFRHCCEKTKLVNEALQNWCNYTNVLANVGSWANESLVPAPDFNHYIGCLGMGKDWGAKCVALKKEHPKINPLCYRLCDTRSATMLSKERWLAQWEMCKDEWVPLINTIRVQAINQLGAEKPTATRAP